MVFVRFLRRLLQFTVHLIEKLLGVLGVASQVEFVGPLSCNDLLVGLLGKPLSRCQVRVASRAYVLGRSPLRE
jgi:hypothetical protein